MFKWQGVSEFAAVVETGSFTAAAKRLGISTAQVSRQVNALEARLASRLLHRTTRKVTVSEHGSTYYQHCRQILDGLSEAEQSLNDLKSKPSGKLDITAPVHYGESVIAPLINDFLKMYPELDVRLHLSNQQLDLIDEGYDLAIRQGNLQSSSLIAKRLASRTLYVCVSKKYIDTFGEPTKLSELDNHNCLQGLFYHWGFQEKGKARNIRISGNLRCNSGRGLADAALKGLGIVQLPEHYVLNYLNSGDLISILEDYRQPDEGIWAVYPQNRHLSPKIRLLLDYLSDSLA